MRFLEDRRYVTFFLYLDVAVFWATEESKLTSFVDITPEIFPSSSCRLSLVSRIICSRRDSASSIFSACCSSSLQVRSRLLNGVISFPAGLREAVPPGLGGTLLAVNGLRP